VQTAWRTNIIGLSATSLDVTGMWTVNDMFKSEYQFWLACAACAILYECGHVMVLKSSRHSTIQVYALAVYIVYFGIGLVGTRYFTKHIATLGGALAGFLVGIGGLVLRIGFGSSVELQLTRPVLETVLGIFCAFLGACFVHVAGRRTG
jgi:hypothetical protein